MAADVLGRGSTAPRLVALLTSAPSREYHTRELVRLVAGTERPVQLALEKLERSGLVRSRRIGNLRLWRADPEHPLYRSLRELTGRTVGVAAKLRETLGATKGVTLAFIFGSYARGDDDASSDIDVFILGNADWDRFDAEVSRVSRSLKREVNAVAWSSEDLARAVRARSPFLATLKTAPKVWLKGGPHEFDDAVERVGEALRGRRPADAAQPGRSRREARARTQERGPRKRAAR